MLGLILWLVLIFIIVVCTYPGFLTFLLCVAPIGIGAYALVAWIEHKLTK